MSVKIKSLLSDSLIYGMSGVISRFISIFLIPIYTKIFTPKDYGTIGLLTNGIAFISILTVLSMDNSTARWFYDTNSEEDRRTTINTWFWFYLVTCILAMAILILFSSVINKTLLDNIEGGQRYIILLSSTLPLTMVTSVANNILRFERKAMPTVFISLSVTLLSILLNIFFILYLRVGLVGVYYSGVISSLAGCCFSLYFLRKWIKFPRIYDFRRLREMLVYSWPFIPASLSIWIVNLSGVFFINGLLNKNDVGLYSIGIALASAVGMITSAFQQAWAPFAYSIIDEPDAKLIYAKVFDLYILIFSTICVCVGAFGKDVLVLLTNPKFYNAYDVATIVCYSYLFIGLVNIADLGLAITKNTKPLGFIMTISAGLIVVLNLTLIPIWGKLGAALALCLSQMINPLYMFYKSNKAYPIPYKFRKALGIILCSITASGICVLFLQNVGFTLGLSLKMGLIIIYLSIVGISYRTSLKLVLNKAIKK